MLLVQELSLQRPTCLDGWALTRLMTSPTRTGHKTVFAAAEDWKAQLILADDVLRAGSLWVQALTHGVVWAMSRTTFRDVVLAGRMQKRAHYEEVLGDMEIFQYLSAANRSSIADCLTAEVYQVRCTLDAWHVRLTHVSDMRYSNPVRHGDLSTCLQPTGAFLQTVSQLSLSEALCGARCKMCRCRGPHCWHLPEGDYWSQLHL